MTLVEAVQKTGRDRAGATAAVDVGVVGVRFRNSRRMYLCQSREYDLKPGDYALVETSQGPEMGKVVMGAAAGSDGVATAGREVIRAATDDDRRTVSRWMDREFAAQIRFLSIATAEGLEISAVRAYYSFDGTRLTFRFRTPGSVRTTTLRDRLREDFKLNREDVAAADARHVHRTDCGTGWGQRCRKQDWPRREHLRAGNTG